MICTEFDEFVENKCIWVAELSDGTRVYQDDDRPDMTPKPAWLRLGIFLQQHPELSIDVMRLRFRSNIVDTFPRERSLYYYSRGLIQEMQTGGQGHHFHIVGWLDNSGQVINVWYKAPELLLHRTVFKDVGDCKEGQIIFRSPP